MASSINASLTAGLVQTADTSGIINLQSGGTTVATISSTGLTSTGGALNGSLGATTPSTVVATTITGNGIANITYSDTASFLSGLNVTNTGNSSQSQAKIYVINNAGDYCSIGRNSTLLGSQSAIFSTGAYPLEFYTDSTKRMTIDSSGNLGLGVTPSAWFTSSGFRAMQIGLYGFTSVADGGSAYTSRLMNNSYYNSSGIATFAGANYASEYRQNAGNHSWYSSTASGTAGNAITFTQAMTLDASGNLLVGKTTAGTGGGNGIQISQTSMTYVCSESSGGSGCYEFYSSNIGAYRFYVTSTGTVFATNTTITAISDQRLKENVRDLDCGLNKILALQPRRFDWKEGKGLDKKDDVGFIAQEFETVFPQSVVESKAGEDGIEYKALNHSELIPTLVKAIQEQQALITSLTARLDEQQAQISVLQGAK